LALVRGWLWFGVGCGFGFPGNAILRNGAFAFGQFKNANAEIGVPGDPQHRKNTTNTMLNIPQLVQIKRRDTYLYESLTQVVNTINAIGRAAGVDPGGSIAAPVASGTLQIPARPHRARRIDHAAGATRATSALRRDSAH
jgi:hypothetical protein